MKNNKFFRAVTVFAVTALIVITYIPLFSVTSSAAGCTHDNVRNSYSPNNDGTHLWQKICMSGCGYTYLVEANAGCSDDDLNGFCDFCYFDLDGDSDPDDESCKHPNCTKRYDSNYDGTHSVYVSCDDCEYNDYEAWAASCFDYNSDGFCDFCGYSDGSFEEDSGGSSGGGSGGSSECKHLNYTRYYDSNNDGTHAYRDICNDCDEMFRFAWQVKCVDSNNDSVCDLCNYKLTAQDKCDHKNVTPRYITQNNGTHTIVEFCNDCGGTKPYPSWEKCFDKDGDGVCERCGYKLPQGACSHTWVDGVCSKCKVECPHDYAYCYPSGKYMGVSDYFDIKYSHGEYIACRICGYDKVSFEVDYHLWEDGKCTECDYECSHEYSHGYCLICKSLKSLYSDKIDYGSWGELFYSKDVKLERTLSGYSFVRSNEYIGGLNLLNLHGLEYYVHNPSYTQITEICSNSITIRDGRGAPNRVTACCVEFYLDTSLFENGSDYTLSFVIDSPWRNTGAYMRTVDSKNVSTSIWPKEDNGKKYLSFTYDSSNRYIIVFHMNLSSDAGYGYAFSATFSNLQIESGVKFTSYMPFGALYIPEYDDVYQKAYKDAAAALDGKAGSGGIVKGLIDSIWGVTQDCFDRLDKATTINGISVGGVISTAIVFVIVVFVLKLVNK